MRRGTEHKYVAMQFWPDIFSAIVAVTAQGITVVEAAGNGDENFDLSAFNNTGLRRTAAPSSSALASRPSNFFDFDGGGGFTGAAYQKDRRAALRAFGSRTTARSSPCMAGAGT